MKEIIESYFRERSLVNHQLASTTIVYRQSIHRAADLKKSFAPFELEPRKPSMTMRVASSNLTF